MDTFTLTARDGKSISCVRWPASGAPRGVVQIAHGLGEHIARYDRPARALTAAGYVVYGNDHRGHGRTDPDRTGDMGPDGWNRVIDDARLLNERILHEQGGLPRILLGHSMGSMLAQQYLYRYGHTVQGVALSGTPGTAPMLRTFVILAIAMVERWRLGESAESELLQKLLFGDANKAYDWPGASGFEWLSRDSAEVQRYVDDPHCGFVLRNGSLVNLFNGAREAARAANVATIPRELPIYVFSGTDDPVHGERRNITRLTDLYRQANLRFRLKYYQGGRHELFNETNSAEVIADLIAWLDEVTA
jgi:alpha-beta hydrolase superfamily lysophospholipase